ncbi:Crp/Fnr family transcriptional regulator [Tenacibaculum sp. E3R01]|uniref:Crp/Fnr family transcriptional regulator n=1 Tax=Tenacibaculum sp. E3R01 TaxID=2267227 RepID=UPI000DEA5C3B|nr:Crp/Fnr family transcriptional regulator [Tenacibaculum sp. E3R01]RBW54332.1 Crp/Fnr family transcriptional regulator [Tenacibaculum sp. E3R01]
MVDYDLIYSPLIKNIKELVTISNKDIELIIDAFVPKSLTKKEILLFKGDTSNHMRFISYGCLRSYHINEAGQEYILQFGIKNWWINDLYSYLTKTPAQYFIQALKPTTVLQIHRDELEKLFNKVPAMERFFRIKMEKAYVANLNRTINSMSETAESRYLNFIKKHREIEQSVPQYMVASYLGISPEHLSTIRKNLHQ